MLPVAKYFVKVKNAMTGTVSLSLSEASDLVLEGRQASVQGPTERCVITGPCREHLAGSSQWHLDS